MKIEDHIAQHFETCLDEHKALVIYDPDGVYHSIVMNMAQKTVTVVDGGASTILGRERAMEAWCRIGVGDDKNLRLIVYLPITKPVSEKEMQQNPYQIFALAGGVFPHGDGDTYAAICRQAAPDLATKIDALFESGLPDFDTVNNLIRGGANWPKLKSLLKSESAVEILCAVLAPTESQNEALTADTAWVAEFKTLLSEVLDYTIKTKGIKLSTVAAEIWRLMLFSEFRLDLPVALPVALKDVPCAAERFQTLVFSVCDSLRRSERHQQIYMDMAEKVAEELQIEKHLSGISELGSRDTFAFEERAYLKKFADVMQEENYTKACDIYKQRSQSIWVRHQAERHQLWTVADRARQVIVLAGKLLPEIGTLVGTMDVIFEFYGDHFRELDMRHRNFEQAVADAYGELDVLGKLVDKARQDYCRAAEGLQQRFLAAVQTEGWPVSGRIRHGEVFTRFVVPLLNERRKIAYFLVDALRYELAVELENELPPAWLSNITAICAQLPTVTRVGMAALMPEADGNLKLVKENGKIEPYVKGQKISSPKDRYNFVQKIYGDRCHMLDLDDLVTKQRIKVPETVQLLMVKTTDIDQFGEINPLEARRLIPRLIQKLIAAIGKTRKMKYDHAVVATDHGFVLFDEQQAGDSVAKPKGEWSLEKSRCLLGKSMVREQVLVFGKDDVGIDGDLEDYVVPKGYGTFVKGSPYAHEGLSLQECVLPVISIDFGSQPPAHINTSIDIQLTYKGGAAQKITTRRPMVEISMFNAMFEETVEFLLVAFSGKEVVGEVATSPHVNPATNMVAIKPGQAIKVPLKMEDEFHGSFEVRAVDPITNVNYATLKLKTDYLD